MKKSTVFLIIAIITFDQLSTAVTSISLIGSNPYFTTQLFPQDLLLRQGNYLYCYPYYQTAPWWGDITNPANKPTTGDYTVTGVDIIDGNASFKHTGSIQTISNTVGYAWLAKNDCMADIQVDYSIDAMRNTASGNMTSSGPYTTIYHGSLPFDYSNRHTLNRFSIQGMLGSTFNDIPFGVKVSGGFENTLSLSRDLSFSKLKQLDSDVYDSTQYVHYQFSDENAHILWGWNTSPCNHIFDVTGPQGDSWTQDVYSIGPLYHFDILGGITLPKVKAGIYYRYKNGHQDQYSWESDPIDSSEKDVKVAGRFFGKYVKNDYSTVKSAWEARVFGNINHQAQERFSLNTFVSLGYTDSTLSSALSQNLDVEPYDKPQNAIRSLAFEVDPNINIRFGKSFNFLDAALLFEYRYSRYSNTSEQTVRQARGRAYDESDVNGEDENIYESFSYANENRFHLGADFNTLFPVFNAYPNHLSLGLMLVGNLRYTFQTKYYGKNSANGSEIDFNVDNRRNNYKREVWFNTGLMLHYLSGPYQLRFEVTEPILYSVLSSTEITDASGNNVLYDHEKSPLWVSQLGMRAGIYASYDIALPLFCGSQKGK